MCGNLYLLSNWLNFEDIPHLVNIEPFLFVPALQEPGTDAEIKEFAHGYNVEFDLFSKIEVNGDNAQPLWKWMKAQPKGKGLLGK